MLCLLHGLGCMIVMWGGSKKGRSVASLMPWEGRETSGGEGDSLCLGRGVGVHSASWLHGGRGWVGFGVVSLLAVQPASRVPTPTPVTLLQPGDAFSHRLHVGVDSLPAWLRSSTGTHTTPQVKGLICMVHGVGLGSGRRGGGRQTRDKGGSL